MCNAKPIAPKLIRSACPLKRGNAHRINYKGIVPQDLVDVNIEITIYCVFCFSGRQDIVPPLLRLHKQSHWADVVVAGGRDVPAVRAGLVPVNFQRDVMPSIGEPRCETLSGVNAVPIQQQAGVRVVVIGRRKFDLAESFAHGVPSFLVGNALHIINREQVRLFYTF